MAHNYKLLAILVALTLCFISGVPLKDQINFKQEGVGPTEELIILFDRYLSNKEIDDILKPLNSRFEIMHEQNHTKNTDFVVVSVGAMKGMTQDLDGLRSKISTLPHVKSTSYNRKIRANFSSFSNLHEANINDPVFFDKNHGRMNHQNGTQNINNQAKRELFLKGDYSNLYEELDLWHYHDSGYTGKGIKIAIFDSGISSDAQDQLNVVEKVDFTNDDAETDMISHGTFIASVIGSKNSRCPGVAPDAELYIFKVFNKDHESYTQWFLKAFNYAIEKGIDIINLSNGSSDFQDNPFIDKINDMTANGITVVSSIGNDGPEQGTLNNPADMTNVIGVGSVNKSQKNLAHFSSRGITTWNLLKGVGIIKPDLITLGEKISGLDMDGSCTVSSGTSVSSGIISGSLAIMLSGLRDNIKKPTPALIKKTLLTTSERLANVPISDQGSGKFNLASAFSDLQLFKESVFTDSAKLKPKKDPFIYPQHLDLTSESYYPYSLISFYSTMMPIAFNFTVINPEVDYFEIQNTKWETDNELARKCFNIQYEVSDQITPYYASIRMLISVNPSTECQYASTAEVPITTYVVLAGSELPTDYKVTLKLSPTPPRSSRILFDAYHNLKFPEDGYILRDSIFVDKQPYEWKGDHIFTNYMHLYKYLTLTHEYHVEVLNEPITCFDSRNYGAYVLADPERTFTKNEVTKLQKDIEKRGLSIIVLADWDEPDMIDKHRFTSEVTNKTWDPVIGGANLKALNTLLKPYGITFKESSYSGSIVVGEEKFKVESGALIENFPNKGYLFSGKVIDDKQMIEAIDDYVALDEEIHPLVGVYDLSDENNNKDSGSILAIGDSYCIESGAPVKCFSLISEFLNSLNQKYKQSLLFSDEHFLNLDFSSRKETTPIEEVYSSATEVCVGPSFYDINDEITHDFKYIKTEEFMTKWKVTDESKYRGYDEFWESLLEFKTEIAILSVVAFLLLSSLLVYIWLQRKRNIQYMKIVPDVDI